MIKILVRKQASVRAISLHNTVEGLQFIVTIYIYIYTAFYILHFWMLILTTQTKSHIKIADLTDFSVMMRDHLTIQRFSGSSIWPLGLSFNYSLILCGTSDVTYSA